MGIVSRSSINRMVVGSRLRRHKDSRTLVETSL
ncbi:hypothetical protein JOE55_002059 [Kocuria palustris]|nr:hypothetical protein [Kocuria palustris]